MLFTAVGGKFPTLPPTHFFLQQGGRTRDHKLQALYRMEVHWLTASQEKQTELEDQILLHLRQVSE